MSNIYKIVDIITQKPILNLSTKINSSTFDLRLSLQDILTCILEKATVLEVLPNGERIRLTLYNYKKDNFLGEETPSESDTSVYSFPFISNELNDEGDAPFLATGNAIRKYVSDHLGADSNGVVTALDAKTFADTNGATLKIKRGLKADLPILKSGEPGVALDEKRLYIGGLNSSIISVPNQSDIDGIVSLIEDTQDDIEIKVDKIAGKDLSTNDYTNTDKNEVAKISNKADITVTTDLQTQVNAMKVTIANLQLIVSGGGMTPFSITSLTAGTTLAELGATINSITFNWAYSGTPSTQSFEGTVLDSALRTYTYSTPVTNSKTFTLSATGIDGVTTKTSTASVNFLNGIYYGVSPVGTYDSTFIRKFTKVLSGTKSRVINLDAPTVTDYIYYCIPKRLGTPIFVVGGFEGGITFESTVAFTNANGYTEDYDIYRSDNGGLGVITINIT